jgi:hypothetical protein
MVAPTLNKLFHDGKNLLIIINEKNFKIFHKVAWCRGYCLKDRTDLTLNSSFQTLPR